MPSNVISLLSFEREGHGVEQGGCENVNNALKDVPASCVATCKYILLGKHN